MNVAVIAGGPSSEAEVSRVSGKAVAAALTEAGHRVSVLELAPGLPEALRTLAPDVVFPVCHGAVGEDGCLQGVLELLALPYVGSGVLPSALAMDKPTARILFRASGLPVAKGIVVRSAEDAEVVVAALGRNVVVKPAAGGSALGVTRLQLGEDLAALTSALARALTQGDEVLVEEFMVGDEVTCGVLDVEPAARALPPTRIEAKGNDFYDFEARYAPGKSLHTCPPPYPAALLLRIQECAVAAHRALGCRDLSRSDFVVSPEQGTITLLETNTMPGFTPTSLYPEAAAVAGSSFAALCDALVGAAVRRGSARRTAAAAFPGA